MGKKTNRKTFCLTGKYSQKSTLYESVFMKLLLRKI